MSPKDERARFKARATKPAEAFVSAEKWLEHLEEEIEPKCQAAENAELDLVLKNSPDDLSLRESLVRVRAAVKALDDVALPESGHYYSDLHSKIMSALETDIAINGEPDRSKSRRKSIIKPFTFSSFKSSFGLSAGLSMMVAVLALIGFARSAHAPNTTTADANAQREQAIEQNFERKIAMVDSHTSAQFARDMGSFESEEDFLTDSAAARLKHVSAQQADAMIRELKY